VDFGTNSFFVECPCFGSYVSRRRWVQKKLYWAGLRSSLQPTQKKTNKNFFYTPGRIAFFRSCVARTFEQEEHVAAAQSSPAWRFAAFSCPGSARFFSSVKRGAGDDDLRFPAHFRSALLLYRRLFTLERKRRPGSHPSRENSATLSYFPIPSRFFPLRVPFRNGPTRGC